MKLVLVVVGTTMILAVAASDCVSEACDETQPEQASFLQHFLDVDKVATKVLAVKATRDPDAALALQNGLSHLEEDIQEQQHSQAEFLALRRKYAELEHKHLDLQHKFAELEKKYTTRDSVLALTKQSATSACPTCECPVVNDMCKRMMTWKMCEVTTTTTAVAAATYHLKAKGKLCSYRETYFLPPTRDVGVCAEVCRNDPHCVDVFVFYEAVDNDLCLVCFKGYETRNDIGATMYVLEGACSSFTQSNTCPPDRCTWTDEGVCELACEIKSSGRRRANDWHYCPADSGLEEQGPHTKEISCCVCTPDSCLHGQVCENRVCKVPVCNITDGSATTPHSCKCGKTTCTINEACKQVADFHQQITTDMCLTCVNTDNGARGAEDALWGNYRDQRTWEWKIKVDCSYFVEHPGDCSHLDDDDFSAGSMCCACGGGIPFQPASVDFSKKHNCTAGTFDHSNQWTEIETPTIQHCAQKCKETTYCKCFTYGTQANESGIVANKSYTSDGFRANDCILTSNCKFVSGWEGDCRWNVYEIQ